MKKQLNNHEYMVTSWEYLKFLSLKQFFVPDADQHAFFIGNIANKCQKVGHTIPHLEVLERTEKFVMGYWCGAIRSRQNLPFPHFPDIHEGQQSLHVLAHSALVWMEVANVWGKGFATRISTLELFFDSARNIPPKVSLESYRTFLSKEVRAERKVFSGLAFV